MRSTIFPSLILFGGLFCLLLFASCAYGSEDIIRKNGTIVFIDLEGGFYAIKADDGTKYDPVNLGKEFQQDGLRVHFEAKEAKELASFRMWGTLIELTKIEKL